MNEFVYEHIVHADLAKPLIRQNFGLVMASGDEKANRFRVELTRNGEDVDASGCSVIGYLIRPNDETLRIPGTADGSTVYVDITDHGYVYDGNFTLTIKVYGDGFATAVAIFDGQIAKTTSENIVDGDRVIYGVEDILAQIDAMETAEANANEAAENANTAADKAKTAEGLARSRAQEAHNAAQQAITALTHLHPVGSIYISVNDTDPAQYFGGTWERIQDTFLLAAGSTYAAGTTGGEATHRLTLGELPSISLNQITSVTGSEQNIKSASSGSTVPVVTNVTAQRSTANIGGSGTAHNNMPPYLAVYVWKRVQ